MQVAFIYFKKYKTQVLVIFLATMIGDALLTVIPYFVKNIIDLINLVGSGKDSIDKIYLLVCIVAFLGLAGNLFFRVSGYFAKSYFPCIRRDVRVDFFSYLHSHTHRYFSNHFWGALTNKIVTVGKATEDVFLSIAYDIIPSSVDIVISLVLLFFANTTIWLVTLLIIILYWVIFFPFMKKARILSWDSSAFRSVSTGKIADVISNIWNLQSHARSKYEETYLVSVLDEEVDKVVVSWWYMERIRIGQAIVMGFFVAAIGTLSIYFWSHGQISIGNVTLVFMISLGILQVVRNFAQRLLDFNERKSEIQEAITTILAPHEIDIIHSQDNEVPITSGTVELQNITFAYDDRGNVFENLSLTIPHGQKVWFVGVSWSGKTTLVLLLQRFYDIQNGSILVWGHDISEISQDMLRRAIAVVPQDPVLFHRSLFENIAYGLPDATYEEVIQASKLAHADEFITLVPEWYEAKVGERGVKLSGWQRQRIAIARAILKAAPVLLLDEATSALDSESEELIQEALKKVMEGKTVIAIAHRLSTLKNMDRIIVLEQWKIIEDGSHEELIKKNGTYAYLYKKQVKGFMTEA